MFKYIAFLLLLVTFPTFGQERYTEQNLVPNPSFERNSGCPVFSESINKVVAWYRSLAFSADYFHTCVSPDQIRNMGVPCNMFGCREPRTGNAYAGISFINEALTVKLIRPLIKDSIYKVEFFVNLADSSDVATRYLGMYISKWEIRYRTDNRNLISEFILDNPPQIQNPRDRYLNDTENWTSINGFYTAKGGEEFITIGGFYAYHDSLVQTVRPARLLKKTYRIWERHIGYYYVDDVSVIPHSIDWQTNITYILKYVYFDFDQIELLPESVDELTRLSAHLKKHLTYNISIKGHTDDFGTDEYNNVLSINRASAVVDWLVNTGKIAPQRITYEGAGKNEPIAENDTEYGRSINRRVEFILTDTVTNTEIRSEQ
jgi:outer membrane protein OmpA-like peptidoglycan-associated protein